MRAITILVVMGFVVAGGRESAAATSDNAAVEFADCVESIGVGLVATEAARDLVPAPFVLVGEGQPVTPLVVRTSDCVGISVDGRHARSGSIVQIGAVIVPPDFSGDINNYTLLYYTSDPGLRTRLIVPACTRSTSPR